jgi:hypothetical protein
MREKYNKKGVLGQIISTPFAFILTLVLMALLFFISVAMGSDHKPATIDKNLIESKDFFSMTLETDLFGEKETLTVKRLLAKSYNSGELRKRKLQFVFKELFGLMEGETNCMILIPRYEPARVPPELLESGNYIFIGNRKTLARVDAQYYYAHRLIERDFILDEKTGDRVEIDYFFGRCQHE